MKFIRLVRNKYFITTLVFLVWMFFFDKNNLVDQNEKRRDYSKLNDEASYYETEIEKARKERDALFTNEKTLEKFAREKYMMKKDNEELFIVIDTTATQGKP